MRGAMRGRMIGGPRPFFKKQFIPHIPFDLYLTGPILQRVSPPWDDSELTAALIKKAHELTPSDAEHQSLLNLVTKLQSVLDQITVDPRGFDACAIDEVRQVGSYRKGTMIAGHNVADFVILLKTFPTEEAVMRLGQKVLEDLRASYASLKVVLTKDPCGFTIKSQNNTSAARCLITTLFPNIRKLETDLHLPQRLLVNNLAALRHSRWFEDNGQNQSGVKTLIRLIRDLRNRFEGLLPLNPWMVDLLCHYSMMNTPDGQPLPLADGFKRTLQLLASGLFTPGSCGIQDPCELNVIRVHTAMTVEEQDIVCMTAQNLVRHLLNGNFGPLLGITKKGEAIERDACVVNGVVINPLGTAYEKPPERGAEEELLEGSDGEQTEDIEGMQTE
ncbi:interleukin enhancer-binding factor 2-like [Tropilaelaps mercedesae]|uniref:Interleukin enhancer-binding factor 2-like n=1 Tax=Tropilaelaps mercedesae TaxID=418985 RepID=A0A1V9XPL1_9ACAR|nr:interleukin enhancer-binding factor 2-like [Tropilaelaps mercedesae]